jgi:hypothetical protein
VSVVRATEEELLIDCDCWTEYFVNIGSASSRRLQEFAKSE